MSSEWPLFPLEDCLDALIDYRGKTPEKTTSGIPLITAKVIKGGRIEKPDEFIAIDNYDAWMRRGIPECGDVVLTVEAPLGEVAQLGPEKIALAQRVVTLRGKANFLDSTYLLYWLQSEDAQEQLKARATGTTVVGIKQSELRKLSVPVPPTLVQREVAKILRSLDDRITLLRETNTTLEAIAQALFKSWFVDFDPVHAKMQGRAPEGMDQATAALFPDSFEESEFGLVPKGWKSLTVGKLVIPKRGKSTTKSKCIDGDVPVVAGGLEPAYFHNQSNVLSPVITVSASGANAGFVRLYQQDIWASDCSFISKEQTDSIYFWYVFLKSNQNNIYFMQQGAAQPHIYPSDLMRLNICMPIAVELINFFNELVTPLFEKIGIANAKIQTLSKLRDTLLPHLISGQISLSEVAASTI